MKALVVVDVQNDFCPGGKLAVPNGDEIVSVINKLIQEGNFNYLISSRDRHPANTKHFEKWPVHCVEDTEGANYHPALDSSRFDYELLKGLSEEDDGYSAFETTHIEKHTPTGSFVEALSDSEEYTYDLLSILDDAGVYEVYIVGLALDYCVKATALDSAWYGFKTYLITDATRAVNLQPNDGLTSLQELEANNVELITSQFYLKQQLQDI